MRATIVTTMKVIRMEAQMGNDSAKRKSMLNFSFPCYTKESESNEPLGKQ